MQKTLSLLLAAVLTLATTTSCSYRQFSAVTAGSSLGGMFGSSIGGLMGGPRRADKGTIAGMVIGGVAAAAATAPRSEKQSSTGDYRTDNNTRTYSDRVEYDTYNSASYRNERSRGSDLEYIEVTNVKFLDANNNQCLDASEQAYIVMDIYNRGDRTLYDVTPQITCSNSRVMISPAAIVGNIPSGQGVRYKAAVQAPRRLKDDMLLFRVNFGSGKQAVEAKSFKIRTSR